MVELFASVSLALVAGVISFTSPCALPLLPGYVSYVSGLRPSSESGALAVRTRRRVLGAALLFVLGFSLVFTALGASASALGFLLARHLRTLAIVGGILVIVMGLATTGLIRLPLLHRQLRFDLSRISHGPAGALAFGAAFAFGWTPCVGPVLATVLTTAASTATVTTGAVLLFTYSIGLGIPFLLVAAGVARGRQSLRWLRRHTRAIEITGGILLVVMGVAIATGGWTVLMSRMLAIYAKLDWPPV